MGDYMGVLFMGLIKAALWSFDYSSHVFYEQPGCSSRMPYVFVLRAIRPGNFGSKSN